MSAWSRTARARVNRGEGRGLMPGGPGGTGAGWGNSPRRASAGRRQGPVVLKSDCGMRKLTLEARENRAGAPRPDRGRCPRSKLPEFRGRPMKLSLHSRFALLVLPSVAFLGAAVIAGAVAFRRVNSELSSLEARVQLTLVAERLSRTLADQSQRCTDFVNTRDPDELMRIESARGRTQQTIADWERLVAGLPAFMAVATERDQLEGL